MCRWLAYSGPRVPLSALLMRPDHSLIDQSRHARQNVETTNGDGFGVGWYGEEETPGVYRDTHPDELTEHWEAVPESSLLVVEDGKTTICSFSPE